MTMSNRPQVHRVRRRRAVHFLDVLQGIGERRNALTPTTFDTWPPDQGLRATHSPWRSGRPVVWLTSSLPFLRRNQVSKAGTSSVWSVPRCESSGSSLSETILHRGLCLSSRRTPWLPDCRYPNERLMR